jgi:cell division protein FtsB
MDYIRKTCDWLHRVRRKLATAGVSLLVVLMLYHVVFGANGMMVYQRKRAEYRELQRQIEQLQKENENLSQRTKALKTDPATIEKEAREQLRYAKPGEVVYLLPSQKSPGQPPANAAAQKK